MVFDGTNVASGLIASLGIKKEVVYGTFIASPISIGVVKNFTHKRIDTIVPLGGIRDSRRAADMKSLGYHYEGAIEGELQNAVPIYMALGEDSVAGSAPYVHTMNIVRGETGGSANYLPSFSVHAQFINWDGTSAENMIGLKGMVVKGLALRIPLNEVATYTMEYVAQDIQTTSVTAPTESALAQYASYNTNLLIDNDAAVYSSGVSVAGMNALEINIDNNVQFDHEFNSSVIRRPYFGSVRDSITAKIDRKYIDTDLTALGDGTPFSFRADLVRTAANDEILILGEYCYISDREQTMNIDNPIENTPIEVKMAKLSAVARDAITSYE